MLICFSDQEGIVHREFVPPAMTVNADSYCDVLRRLRENVRRKRPQKWRNQYLIIHRDNVPAHRSFKLSQFLAKNNMTVIPHTPYSPDLAPVTFSSSPRWSFEWRVEHSTPLKRFKRNRSGYLTHFQKGTSRDASKHGRNAGTAVFVEKGSTVKVMEEFNIQGKQTSFYKYCPGTFGYTVVHPSSGACNLFVELFHGLYCSCSMWFGWGGVVWYPDAGWSSTSACFSRITHHTTPAKPQRNTKTHRTRTIQPIK